MSWGSWPDMTLLSAFLSLAALEADLRGLASSSPALYCCIIDPVLGIPPDLSLPARLCTESAWAYLGLLRVEVAFEGVLLVGRVVALVRVSPHLALAHGVQASQRQLDVPAARSGSALPRDEELDVGSSLFLRRFSRFALCTV